MAGTFERGLVWHLAAGDSMAVGPELLKAGWGAPGSEMCVVPNTGFPAVSYRM